MKKLLAIFMACGLASSAFAIGVGKFKINPEIGASFGTATNTDTFLVGGFGRVWLGGSGVTIAPQFKYNYIMGQNDLKGFSNIQVGGLLGYKLWRFTPYIGGSWSNFGNIALNNTAALNYGVTFDIPILPLSIGLDASWQNPKIAGTDIRQSQHQIALTLALYF
ncbi:outer membrane protein [Helicobacter fennelliae]|uniref:Outer membrane protein n=1 Tax=Helicobacter fennelliae TaxID=215 RepID=A0A2X3B365_9HELI|nr:hypothetical protein [Helicobacter fennelliae]SQB98332.1 outer membrane protein [Helicobacter fennelliae]